MSINKENIEEHIFDYLEGNLTDEQITEFREYISSNEEAKSELNYWKQSYVDDNIHFDSSNFNSLKKSNKRAYWLAGVGIAFVLGLSTMWVFNQKDAESTKKVRKSVPVTVENESSTIEKSVEEEAFVDEQSVKMEEYIPVSIESSKMETPVVEDEEEVNQIENIEAMETRNVELDTSTSDREIVSEKIKIEKEKTNQKPTKKEVDVIELNSEGF